MTNVGNLSIDLFLVLQCHPAFYEVSNYTLERYIVDTVSNSNITMPLKGYTPTDKSIDSFNNFKYQATKTVETHG